MATAKQGPTGSGVQKSVKTLLDEAEKTGDELLREVKHQFETLSQKISAAAGSAADTLS